VAAGSGAKGVVVRGADLVAVDVQEYRSGFPYFQIEYLLKAGAEMKFDRFQRFVLYLAVVWSAEQHLDEALPGRLEALAREAPCEVPIRMYRLNLLRRKYST